MKRMKCAELVLDYDLYPRNNVDNRHVSDIANSLAAGATLPPVIADQKSKRVADGFHRTKAHLQLYGDKAEIDVILKTYKSDADLFLDAMRYNAGHGAKLDTIDRVRCMIVADKLRLTVDQVAGALCMDPKKLGDLRADRTAKAGKLQVPIKRTIRHMAGKVLTQRQQEANTKLSGMQQVFYVNQLIELIESGMLDKTDEQLMQRLLVLHGLIGTVK